MQKVHFFELVNLKPILHRFTKINKPHKLNDNETPYHMVLKHTDNFYKKTIKLIFFFTFYNFHK